MAKFNKLNPLAAALGAAVVASALSAPVMAAENPFAAKELSGGYTQLAGEHGKGGEGKCGEGKCGEGKCGEGKCGEDKGGEGKCGEGKCGEDKKDKKGKKDKGGEGKCGEGKCGG
ncbi:MAG: hypothetical protein ACK4SX_07345 [Alcanivoracaceae bacterium]